MKRGSSKFRTVLTLALVGLVLTAGVAAFFLEYSLSFTIGKHSIQPHQHETGAVTGQGFHRVGNFQAIGDVAAYRIGPGKIAGSQMLYGSYTYYGSTFDLVSIDPYTGAFNVHNSPVSSEEGADAMVVGPDGNIYLGTWPHAHLVKYDLQSNTITDLGRPSLSEQYIWDAALGADDSIYAVTYPDAKLIRFDPATRKAEDLGRADPKQQYARYIVASRDGFLYIGIGSAQTTVVAYNIATGEKRAILPYNRPGFAQVFLGRDNNIYAELPDGTAYLLSGWAALPIDASSIPQTKATASLKDGTSVGVVGNTLSIYQPGGRRISSRVFAYRGKKVQIFRIALGPDGNLYGSSILPAYLLRVEIADSPTVTVPVDSLTKLPYAEVYSFLRGTTGIFMAGYGYKYPLALFSPEMPVNPATNPKPIESYIYPDWRPEAMVQGPGNQIFIGALPGYGKLGGVLADWDSRTNTVTAFSPVVTDQSPISLTIADGKVIGGTSIYGGEGSVPTQSYAKLFVWDPITRTTVYETAIIPNATSVSNLITLPNGLVYGVAGNTAFTFNQSNRQISIVGNIPVPSSGTVYNSNLLNNIAIGSDGNIWGLYSAGVFTINVKTNVVRIIPAPVPITGGYAFIHDKAHGDRLYFLSGSQIYIYFLPR